MSIIQTFLIQNFKKKKKKGNSGEDNAIVDNESDKDNTFCIALLHQYRTHTYTQFFKYYNLLYYTAKLNSNNSYTHLFYICPYF